MNIESEIEFYEKIINIGKTINLLLEKDNYEDNTYKNHYHSITKILNNYIYNNHKKRNNDDINFGPLNNIIKLFNKEEIILFITYIKYNRFSYDFFSALKTNINILKYCRKQKLIYKSADFENNVILESVENERISSLSRTLFNLSNIEFCKKSIQSPKEINAQTEISPFTKLGLYTYFDTKINNEIDNHELDNYIFHTLDIIKDSSGRMNSNSEILKRIRNGLAHDQFYIFPKNDKLYIHINNKKYFEATIELEELFNFFDTILNNPISHINFDDESETKKIGFELLLSLIFNSNKDHFLNKYVLDSFSRIDASKFNSNWIEHDRESEKEFKSTIFTFNSPEEKNLFHDEYGQDKVEINLKRSALSKIVGVKFKIFKDKKIPYLFFRKNKYKVDLNIMSYDSIHDIHIPTNILMTKLRNSVAHGQYEYDEEMDSYIFHNYYKGTERFRTTITRKELEKFLLESQLIETVLTPTHILNIMKYESEQNDTQLSEINRYIQSTKINPKSNFSLQKYQNMVMGIIDKLNNIVSPSGSQKK